MRFYDSHAHLTDDSFAAELDSVLRRAGESGVESIVCVASVLEDARRGIELAGSTAAPRLSATAGIHPHHADVCSTEALAQLETTARSDRVAAIGETGLDYHYENAPRQAQLEAFRAQLELAERLDLPVIVHSRDASADVAQLIREFAGRVVGVLHCFTGSQELLRAGLECGWSVSFSGLVTFKNYRDGELLREVPRDRLLVETDSPYLAPVPLRGRRNEPAFVEHVVRGVAEIRDERPEEVARVTYENAVRLFGHGA